jgi:hypothetical protein
LWIRTDPVTEPAEGVDVCVRVGVCRGVSVILIRVGVRVRVRVRCGVSVIFTRVGVRVRVGVRRTVASASNAETCGTKPIKSKKMNAQVAINFVFILYSILNQYIKLSLLRQPSCALIFAAVSL